MGALQIPEWAAGPPLRLRPPPRGSATLRRRRLEDALAAVVDAHRLTLVSAPAGYGKTTFLADWVRRSSLRCAWLSLDRFDTRPQRLYHGVVGALQSAGIRVPAPGLEALTALGKGLERDPAVSHDVLLSVLEHLTEPVALVIDDIQLAGTGLASGVVGMLATSAPQPLRLILSGRGHPPLQLERLRHGEGIGEFGAAELAFTRDEVAEFAVSLGYDPGFDAGPIWRRTHGWPVAVHAGLNTSVEGRNVPGGGPVSFGAPMPLADYIAEEILDQLDPPLANFILRATTCDWLGHRLAVQLQGGSDGGTLLEACRRDGLFIEEHEYGGGESMFRWQPLFAAQCRRILERRDPLLAERMHRVAARHYEDIDVCQSVAHALRGHAARQAVASLGEHWLEYLLFKGAGALEQVCRDLPSPWNEDPEILMVVSVCRALDGDSVAASELTQLALARTSVLDAVRRRKFDGFRALFEPLPPHGRPDERSPAGYSQPSSGETPTNGPATTSGLFLLAEAEFRLRRIGDLAALMLQPTAATVSRWGTLEAGSMADLALAFACAGDIATADDIAVRALDRADGLGRAAQDRMAAAWLARGIASYWRDELGAARAQLVKARCVGGNGFALSPLSVLFCVLVDCASGDEDHLADSSSALESYHQQGSYAGSWKDFHTIAKARIAEADGDVDGALALAAPLGAGGGAPLVDVLLAELLRRGGESRAAVICAKGMADRHRNRCLDASMSLTEALLAHAAGDEAQAHERIEHAVLLAESQSVLRPFTERRDELADLLIRHAVWGTSHESFIAARMARHADVPRHLRTRSYWTLTDREREVLAYMRSVMTAAEIADALYISVNTVKTHERSIYRKLGAAGRREAIKTAAERGIV